MFTMVRHTEAQKNIIMYFENFETSFKNIKMNVNRCITCFKQSKSRSKKYMSL